MNEFKIGDFIVVSNGKTQKQLEILGVDIGLISVMDTLSLVQTTRNLSEINELILLGKALLVPSNKKERQLFEPHALEFAGYPEAAKNEARRRHQYICEVIDADVPAFTGQYLDPVRSDVGNKLGEKPPSVRTICRWYKSYISAGSSIKGLLSFHHNKGNFDTRIKEKVESFIEQAIEHFKTQEEPSLTASHDMLKTYIEYYNAHQIEKEKKFDVPSIKTFSQRVQKVAPIDLARGRKGKRIASIIFKQNKYVPEISFILQRAEIDHTKLDLFVLDDKTRMPLGRPWVTVLLDYKSRSVLGFNIGFEEPSYLSVSRALHHAISSKSYVKNLYPSVKNDWLCSGKPAVIVTDCGKDFRSQAFEDACLDLGIIISRNPGKHPWYKGVVERYFRTINQKFLNDKKGKVMDKLSDVTDYNPEKNAIISLPVFLEIFHIWLIDIYHCEARSEGTLIAREAWIEDLESVNTVAVNPDRLDIVLAEEFEPTLNKSGIKKDYLFYDNDELTKYRMHHGFIKVRIKRKRDDLGYIHVFDEYEKKYFKVPAVNQKYAAGLTLHQHKMHKRYIRKYIKDHVDDEALAMAKMAIIQIIEAELTHHNKTNKIAAKQKASRYLDIGQEKSSFSETLATEADKYKVPKEPESINKEGNNGIPDSDFDGTDNYYPDELDF